MYGPNSVWPPNKLPRVQESDVAAVVVVVLVAVGRRHEEEEEAEEGEGEPHLRVRRWSRTASKWRRFIVLRHLTYPNERLRHATRGNYGDPLPSFLPHFLAGN